MPNKCDWWNPNKYTDALRFKYCLNARYQEVEWARYMMLNPNCRFNENDFKEYTKMLFENGMVYISDAAFQLINQKNPKYFNYTSPYPESITLNQLWKGYPPINYLQDKVHQFGDLIWEHVVPINVIIDHYLKSQHTYLDYLECLKYGVICIITKDENNNLTSNKFNSKMPGNWNWGDCVWARYKQPNILVSPISSITHP